MFVECGKGWGDIIWMKLVGLGFYDVGEFSFVLIVDKFVEFG